MAHQHITSPTGHDRRHIADLTYGGRIPADVNVAIEAQIVAERRVELAALEARSPLVISSEKIQAANGRYVEADDAALQAILLWKQHRSCGKAWVHITNPDFSGSSDWVALSYVRERACAAWRMRKACRKDLNKLKAAHAALLKGAASERMHTAVAFALAEERAA